MMKYQKCDCRHAENLYRAQVQDFSPGPGPGQDLTGTLPGLDLNLTWDLEWDLYLSLTIYVLKP